MSKDLIKKDQVVTNVESQIKQMTKEKSLELPQNYSAGNALNAAWLELQQTKDKNGNKALQVCNKPSIQQALLDMVLQGLNPGKDQCYFVVYGKKLVCMPSYHGAAMVVKRLPEVFDIIARLIFEDDELTYDMDDGDIIDLNHKQKFGNRENSKIVGAYAVIKFTDDRRNYIELMNMEQIRNAWKMGASNGNSKAHKKFPGEMSKKVVLGRAAKHYIKTSDDAGLLAEAYTRQENILYEESAQQEVEENANSEDFQEAVEVESESEKENSEPETTDNYTFLKEVSKLKKEIPEKDYEELKQEFGVEKSNQILDRETQKNFYKELKKVYEYYQEE